MGHVGQTKRLSERGADFFGRVYLHLTRGTQHTVPKQCEFALESVLRQS